MENFEEYEEIIKALEGELPSIPVIMNELMKIISNPDAALFAIKDILKLDQAIFSKLIKVANSVAHREGTSQRISDISDAMQRIGLEKVKQVALKTSVLKIFTKDWEGTNFNFEDLWLHSSATAIANQALAEYFESEYLEHAYACGLLHDIGKVAKIQFAQEEYGKEVRYAYRKNLSTHSSENARNFLHHEILGALIIKRWGLSELVEKTTRWHHVFDRKQREGIEEPSLQKFIDILILSNHLVHDLKIGNSGYVKVESLPRDFFKRFRKDDSEYENCKNLVSEKIEEQADFMAIFQNQF